MRTVNATKRELTAWQHIYANVEKEQSPGNTGGFQTLLRTRSALTEPEVEEIEARLLYYPSETEPVKRVFFATSTDKVVLAQIVSLPERDRHGRSGRYLAHSLVCSRREFAAIGTDLFRVFDRFPFAATVEEALGRGDPGSGDIPPMRLGLPNGDPAKAVEAAKLWPGGELGKLASAALRAGSMARDVSALAVVGDPAEIQEALAVALLFVPTALATQCSFDTYYNGCSFPRPYFWAVGLPEAPNNPKLTVVEARSRRVGSDAPELPRTAYERWVAARLRAGDLTQIAQYKDHAFAICEWLEERPYDRTQLERAPDEVVDAVARAAADVVRARLQAKLHVAMPPVLADRVFARLYPATAPAELLRRMHDGFALSWLQDVLHEAYADGGFEPPERDEQKALGALLDATHHRDLRLVLLCWAGRYEDLRRELGRLTDEQYRRFVRAALRFRMADPLVLMAPRRGDAYLEELDASGVAPQVDLLSLVTGLLKIQEAAAIARLSPRVRGLPEADLKTLSKMAAKKPAVPIPFRMAIREALAALPPRDGLGERTKRGLRKLLGPLGGDRD